MARAALLAQAALAQHLDHLAARRVRALAVQVARCVAVVHAVNPFFGAFLLANVRLHLARALVAGLDALVLLAFERLGARQTAAKGFLAARDDFALLVLAVAELGGECYAWWAVLSWNWSKLHRLLALFQ